MATIAKITGKNTGGIKNSLFLGGVICAPYSTELWYYNVMRLKHKLNSLLAIRKFGLVLLLTVIFAVLSVGSVYAYVSSGGDASKPTGNVKCTKEDHSRNGCAWSSKGWGWFKYSIETDVGPSRSADGASNWASMKSACKNDGATSVIAFIILEVNNGNPNGDGVVYNYNHDYDGNRNHKSGGSWMSTESAENSYKNIPDDQKRGFEWAKNVAWFCYDYQAKWTVNSNTHIKYDGSDKIYSDSGWKSGTIDVEVGNTLYWKHTLQATNDKIDKKVTWELQGTGGTGGFFSDAQLHTNTGSTSSAAKDATFAQLGYYSGASTGFTVYTTQSADVGKTLCEYVGWYPISWNNNGWGYSTQACANVKYTYSLTPNQTIATTVVNPGGKVSGISTTVVNSAKIQQIDKSASATVRFVVPATQVLNIPATGTLTSAFTPSFPCMIAKTIAPVQTFCTRLAMDLGGRQFSSTPTSIYSGDDNLIGASLPLGGRVCYVTMVNKYDNSNTSASSWKYAAKCIPIKKTPSVQILGNDVRVGSSVIYGGGRNTSKIVGTTQFGSSSNHYYGSWSEYGLIAPSTISGVASGSGFSNGTASSSQADWSKFTFANKLTYGRFATDPADLGTLPSVASDIGDFSFDTIITGGSIGAWPGGKSVLVQNIGGAVTITGNIDKPTGYAGLADMPQMIIVADDIVINSNVTNVDAWLVAKNTIKTCNVDIATQLTASQCNQQLRINGPVMANKLFLLRTFGADSPATLNIIDLRADTYMWVRYQAELTGGLRTA